MFVTLQVYTRDISRYVKKYYVKEKNITLKKTIIYFLLQLSNEVKKFAKKIKPNLSLAPELSHQHHDTDTKYCSQPPKFARITAREERAGIQFRRND